MGWRFSSFVIFQWAGGLSGWWLAHAWGALVGVVAASLLWFVLDLWRGARILRWLRHGESANAPAMRGLWGEVADRTRRLLRTREQQTQESQIRLQEFLAAIQASPNGVVLLDAQGGIEWCNLMAADQFGIDAQRDTLQFIGNLVRDPAFAAYYAGRDYSHGIVMPGRSSAPARPVKLSVNLYPYGEGRKLLLSSDVTALEQAETMRRDFVANVSHEIRTPLTVLTGFVETLQTLPLNEQERGRYLAMMAQQSSRMQTLVNDLLTLSRLEGSPPPSLAEWTSVQALMVQCEQEGRALSAVLTPKHAKGHDLRFEALRQAGSLGEIAGSQSELHSALSNLLSNAIRYTPAGGLIEVQWQVLPDGRAEFSVKDSGPGIAPEHILRLTERFYRVDRSRSRETGGTGLGLAIVKHVLQRHGAELRIDSTPGLGSRFAVVFPASRLRFPTPAASSQGLAASQPATEAPQK